MNVLRSDLKLYETAGTGAGCSGAKLENSTAIQVNPGRLWAVFQCSYRPPRARSRFELIYDSGSADQGQFMQYQTVNCTGGQMNQERKMFPKGNRPLRSPTSVVSVLRFREEAEIVWLLPVGEITVSDSGEISEGKRVLSKTGLLH